MLNRLEIVESIREIISTFPEEHDVEVNKSGLLNLDKIKYKAIKLADINAIDVELKVDESNQAGVGYDDELVNLYVTRKNELENHLQTLKMNFEEREILITKLNQNLKIHESYKTECEVAIQNLSEQADVPNLSENIKTGYIAQINNNNNIIADLIKSCGNIEQELLENKRKMDEIKIKISETKETIKEIEESIQRSEKVLNDNNEQSKIAKRNTLTNQNEDNRLILSIIEKDLEFPQAEIFLRLSEMIDLYDSSKIDENEVVDRLNKLLSKYNQIDKDSVCANKVVESTVINDMITEYDLRIKKLSTKIGNKDNYLTSVVHAVKRANEKNAIDQDLSKYNTELVKAKKHNIILLQTIAALESKNEKEAVVYQNLNAQSNKLITSVTLNSSNEEAIRQQLDEIAKNLKTSNAKSSRNKTSIEICEFDVKMNNEKINKYEEAINKLEQERVELENKTDSTEIDKFLLYKDETELNKLSEDKKILQTRKTFLDKNLEKMLVNLINGISTDRQIIKPKLVKDEIFDLVEDDAKYEPIEEEKIEYKQPENSLEAEQQTQNEPTIEDEVNDFREENANDLNMNLILGFERANKELVKKVKSNPKEIARKFKNKSNQLSNEVDVEVESQNLNQLLNNDQEVK